MKTVIFLLCLVTLSFAWDLSSHPLLSPLYRLKNARSEGKRSTEGGPMYTCPVYKCVNESEWCGSIPSSTAFRGILTETRIFLFLYFLLLFIHILFLFPHPPLFRVYIWNMQFYYLICEWYLCYTTNSWPTLHTR
jgi:hypothetical protein